MDKAASRIRLRVISYEVLEYLAQVPMQTACFESLITMLRRFINISISNNLRANLH